MKTTLHISKLLEHLLVEGKHWPEDYKKTAYNTIKNSSLGKSGWYSDDFIVADIDNFTKSFAPLSHKNSNLGYFATIIKWFCEYAGTDQKKYQEFIERKLDGVIRDLLWLSNSPSEESKVKEQLKTKWTFADFEKYQKDVVDKKRNVDISIKDSTAVYELIPIKSFRQLNTLFGGDKTGYNGRSEWCHTNGVSTYNDWVDNDKNKFFILARKNWKSIKPPEPGKNAYDTYGTSLIALLVEIRTLKLLNATLRWNHIIEPSQTVEGTSVDNAFNSFEQLEKLSNLNIRKIIENDLKEELAKIKKLTNESNAILENLFTFFKHGIIERNVLDNIAKKHANTSIDTLKQYVTEVTVPEGIETLEGTFKGFENLKTVHLPKTLKNIGLDAFQGCTNLESIEIPNGVKSIYNYAFHYCTNLTSIELPDSVTEIGGRVFEGCKKLKSVKFGPNVTLLGGYVFSFCDELENINFEVLKIKSIQQQTFYKCSNLKSLILPNSVKYIRDHALFGCNKLKHLVLPKHLLTVGEATFFNTGIEKIELPASVTKLGEKAFKFCFELKEIIIKSKIKELKYETFSGCRKLKNVVLPNTLEEIESCAFYECTNLTQLDVPSSVKYIHNSAFYFCSKMKKLIFRGQSKEEVESVTRQVPHTIKIIINANESISTITYSELRKILLR